MRPVDATRRLPFLSALAALAASATMPKDLATAQGSRDPQIAVVRVEATERNGDDLRRVLENLRGPARVELLPGHHHLTPLPYEDPLCGNCEDPNTKVPATVGLKVTGRGIHIIGFTPDSVIIHTHAGYGILFEDCHDCALRGVAVTDATRDPDGRATDAAVVVRRSSVTIEDCHIHDNVGDSATVASVIVGVMGIAGREGADIHVRNCRITRNSWDGVALYRGAKAVIRDNVIDGVDQAAGARIGGGRGVGIGITWDAQAVIEGNLVTRYWKGIGIFVDARAEVRQNIVEDVLTWGIAYWDADRGEPVAIVEQNAVYRTGACGVALMRNDESDPRPGRFVGNAVVMTGQNPRYDSGEPYCRQEALAEHAVPAGFMIANNLFYANREAGGAAGGRDISQEDFLVRVKPLVELLARRPTLACSHFAHDFGGP